MSSVKTTNLFKRKLIRELIKLSNKTKKPLWKRVAEELSRPRRKKSSREPVKNKQACSG